MRQREHKTNQPNISSHPSSIPPQLALRHIYKPHPHPHPPTHGHTHTGKREPHISKRTDLLDGHSSHSDHNSKTNGSRLNN
jgi:hypothetical protein